MDESPLLALPDDALLAVLAFLPPRQLFSCRVLCRRLRDLCLHRDLWRRVRMWERSMWRAALSLAPCLRELDLYDMDDLVEVAVEVAGNACAVAELSLNVKNDDDVMAATEIVKKIAGLGGLTAFRLFISNYRFGEEFDLGELFKAVNNVDHLTHLEVHNELLSGEVASYDSEGSPSVKKLIYFSRTKDSLLGTLIETHAATLEYVHLDTEHVPMSALAECPRLRSLTFELNPKEDLSDLKALPSLAALDFACDVSFSPGALKLLCGAPHLRSVHLRSVNNFSRSEPLPLPLRALAASPSARHLEVLDVDVFNYMIAALPEFPSLRDLTLTVDSRHIEDFLRAVSPSAAPRLAMLALFDAGGACPHALLHRAAVESLLDRNPRLHLRVLNVGPCSYEPKCEWCKLGCQADFKAAYASHAKGDDCPRDCQRLPC